MGTHFKFSKYFFSKSRGVCVIMYGTARQATADNVVWSVRIACWMTTAIDTHSEYVTVIAFLLQLWLRERTSMLRCTCFACLAVT